MKLKSSEEVYGIKAKNTLPTIHSYRLYQRASDEKPLKVVKPKPEAPKRKPLDTYRVPRNASLSVNYKSMSAQLHLKEQYRRYLSKLYENENQSAREYLQDIQRLEEEVAKDGGDTYSPDHLQFKYGEKLRRTSSVQNPS